MNIAICENDSNDLNHLKKLLTEYAQMHSCEMKIDSYASAEELLASPERFQYELIFFDIYMNGINGVDAARELSKYASFHIVFCTTSMDYALDAIHMNAVHYLLKPITAAGIETVLKRCEQRILHDVSVLTLMINKQTINVPQTSIHYIEKFNKIACVHTDTGDFQSYTTLDELEQQLDPKLFMRPHRSYLVNLSYIQQMDSKSLTLRNNAVISLSRKTGSALRQRYHEFLFQLARSHS